MFNHRAMTPCDRAAFILRMQVLRADVIADAILTQINVPLPLLFDRMAAQAAEEVTEEEDREREITRQERMAERGGQ